MQMQKTKRTYTYTAQSSCLDTNLSWRGKNSKTLNSITPRVKTFLNHSTTDYVSLYNYIFVIQVSREDILSLLSVIEFDKMNIQTTGQQERKGQCQST